MKRILMLVAISLLLCSTGSAFQGGGGQPTKKKAVPKKKTSGSKSVNATPARRPASPTPTRTPRPATTSEQAADRERKYEALRIAERTRVEQGITGRWSGVFGSHPDAQLIITKDGTAINGVLLSEGVRETLRGELLTNNRLMLRPISVTRMSGTGNYSPDTILVELGLDGSSLKGSFGDTSNHTGSVAMTRRSVQLTSETEASTTLNWASVSAGSSYVCAVTKTGLPYCWGSGHGDISSDEVYGSPGLVAVLGDLSVAMVSAGNGSTCWVTTSGAAYCSGGNDYGQLGNGKGSTGVQYGRDSAVPTAVVGGLKFSVVSVGNKHACGLTTNGAAYCWGDNTQEQLGNIDKVWTTNDSVFIDNRYGSKTAESAVPFAVGGGLRFATLSAGAAHTCAVTTDGAAYCWGEGSNGQLGNGTTARSARPVAVAGGLNFAAVTASITESFTCGLTTSGAAYCWGLVGDNDNLQLGNGNTGSSLVPVAVAGGLSFTVLSAGGLDVCGVTTEGAAYCWGKGGKLGTGGTKEALTPVPVAGGLKFSSISSGGSVTCGVTTTGTVSCWGDNRYGELGGATTARNSLVPVAMRMRGDEDGFKAFFREFCSAVRRRDRAALELMMSPTIKFPVEITSPNMAFDYLGYKNGKGWEHLEESVTKGTSAYKDSSPQSAIRVTNDARSLFGPGSVFFGRGSDGKWRWIRYLGY